MAGNPGLNFFLSNLCTWKAANSEVKMKNLTFLHLPDGYRLFREIRLEKDRKAQIFMITGQLVLMAVMIYLGFRRCSPAVIFSQEGFQIALRLAAMAVGLFVYIIGHEWVHGVFIRIFSGEPAAFGFRKGMAYAASKAYFSKWPYVIIALAPLIVWGVLLGFLTGDVGEQGFWYIYAVQIFNVAGAVGDIYVSIVVLGMPKNVLVIDEGTAMKFFVPQGKDM